MNSVVCCAAAAWSGKNAVHSGPAIGRFIHYEDIDGRLWPQTFHWLPVAAVTTMDLYPLFLRQALWSLPDTPRHIVNDERLVMGG